MSDEKDDKTADKKVKKETPEQAVKNNKELVLMVKDGRKLPVNRRLVADHQRRGWRQETE